MDENPREVWRSKLLSLQRAGDYLQEYDQSQLALEDYPDEEYFQYCAVLALARCNATQRALKTFYSYSLHHSTDEYVRTLEARLLKNIAFQNLSSEKPFASYDRSAFSIAAATYVREFARTGSHYAVVNAATLSLFAGEAAAVAGLARQALELARTDTGPPYYALATQAEASLLLGNLEQASDYAQQAAQYNQDNLQTRAHTYAQLGLICDFLNFDKTRMAALLPESIVHYCGHVFFNHRPLKQQEENELACLISEKLDQQHVAIAYGSLMAGSDILFAEALLKRGSELNVWLPFGEENFCAVNVRPTGADWEARFWNCLRSANSVSYVTESDFLGDEILFELCSNVAMGMAAMRAQSLQCRPLQLAVWDPALQSRGTYANLQKWHALGRHTELITSPPVHPRTGGNTPRQVNLQERRVHKAILFADVQGFSKLNDQEILWYYNTLMPSMARIIDRHRDSIDHLNTWGDGIYLVTSTAGLVAHIAIELMDAFEETAQIRFSSNEPLQLRIGLHYGPVYRCYDHLTQSYTFSSHDVIKTARIEPVTPPGEIFGTEPLVAMLVIEGVNEVTPEYAGTISSAKNFGAFRMFHIRTRVRETPLLCVLPTPESCQRNWNV